jgi:hypothetical protein
MLARSNAPRSFFLRQFQFACLRIAKARAAERPFFWRAAKLGLHWIIFDVADGFTFLFLVSHKAIPIFRLPKTPGPSNRFICFDGRKGFPILHDLGEWDFSDFNQHMHMVGHDDPRQHSKALVVMM